MNYAILRAKKLKSAREVQLSLRHAFRDQDTPNADPEKRHLNTYVGTKNEPDAMARFRKLLPEKVRKNGVVCVEYLITASPEAMNGKTRLEQDRYFEDAINWLMERHGGGTKNLVHVGVHRDESTPHMYAYVVPIDNRGRLNASAFLDGGKMLSEMQTDFANRVGQPHGLERGIEGSRAKHQRVKRFYGQLDQELPQVAPQDVMPRPGERAADVAARINQTLAPAIERGATAAQDRARAAEMVRTANALARATKEAQEAVQRLEERFKPALQLEQEDPEDLDDLLRHAENMVSSRRRTRLMEEAKRRGEEPDYGNSY